MTKTPTSKWAGPLLLAVVLPWMVACGRETPSITETNARDSSEVQSRTAETTPDNSPAAANLQAQLDDLQRQYAKMAPAMIDVVDGVITELTATGILERSITKGDKAPNFTLPDAIGRSVSLYDELEKGPVILTWYRGSWCPFCNIQLHDYQEALGDIHAVGAQLLAVSPELPDSSLSWKEKNELEFIVLSDIGNRVARQYGIVFRIPDTIADSYREGGRIDLAAYNGDDSLELPLAVTYVIASDGTVEYAFVDADWRKRAETSEIVEVVTRLATNRR